MVKEEPQFSYNDIFSEAVLNPIKEKVSNDQILDYIVPTTKISRLEESTKELLKKEEQIIQWIKDGI